MDYVNSSFISDYYLHFLHMEILWGNEYACLNRERLWSQEREDMILKRRVIVDKVFAALQVFKPNPGYEELSLFALLVGLPFPGSKKLFNGAIHNKNNHDTSVEMCKHYYKLCSHISDAIKFNKEITTKKNLI